jgi:hypothetical protein
MSLATSASETFQHPSMYTPSNFRLLSMQHHRLQARTANETSSQHKRHARDQRTARNPEKEHEQLHPLKEKKRRQKMKKNTKMHAHMLLVSHMRSTQ